jgi:hypothetical protein
MGVSQMSEEQIGPVQLSLRIRHPAMDPGEISTAIGVEPEHCFKAGDARTSSSQGRRAGLHSQSYWLAPITAESWAEPDPDPAFLSVIAGRYSGHNLATSEEHLRQAAQSLRSRSVEANLFYCLQRLNTRHAFLERIQSEGGDVSLLLGLAHDSATDFTLPVAMSRLLVKLGISLEFKFEAAEEGESSSQLLA